MLNEYKLSALNGASIGWIHDNDMIINVNAKHHRFFSTSLVLYSNIV